jgi:hypothetical protein
MRSTICLLWVAMSGAAFAQQPFVHGLWVWKTPSVLAAPNSGEALVNFCRAQTVNEVYLSYSPDKADATEEQEVAGVIASLHRSGIRVEALLSSVNADEPGAHRDKLLGHVRAVLEFNRKHPRSGFDGIHLDVEPHQRPENKGPGNLVFLPDLLETYREVRALAEQNRMTVNADIPNKFLKGDLGQRHGQSSAAQADKLGQASENYFSMAYQGLSETHLAKMAIGLRTPDYQSQLPNMLKTVQQDLSNNPHYLGWAWHSYNDAQ